MTVLAVKHDFELQCCPHCSAAFMLPTIDLEARTANGRSHFCPNGHEVRSSAENELAHARWQLSAALTGWEEDTGELKAEVAGLQQQLAAEKARTAELIAQVVAGQDDASELAAARAQLDGERAGWLDEKTRLEATIAELQQKPEAPETEASTVLAYGSGAAPITLELLVDMAKDFMPAPPDVPPIGAYADDDPEAHAAAVVVTTWRDRAEPKTCGNRDCRKEFRPSPNVAEAIWKKQKFCSHKCAVKENARLAKERREQQAAVLPTLTDPQYGGPEAPPEAVEQAEQVTDQVADPAGFPTPQPMGLEPTRSEPGQSEPGQLPAELLPIEQLAEPEPAPERTNTPPTVETSPPEEVVTDTKKHEGGLAPRATAITSPPEPVSTAEPTVIFRGRAYPARFAELLTDERYEPKACACCRKPLAPKLKDGKLEPQHYYALRQSCSKACSVKRNNQRFAEARRNAASSLAEPAPSEPQPFMDESFMTKDKVLCELALERAERGFEHTGEKVELDRPLLLKLFAVFDELGPDVEEFFLDVFGKEHPVLIEGYREDWQTTHPRIKERLLAA